MRKTLIVAAVAALSFGCDPADPADAGTDGGPDGGPPPVVDAGSDAGADAGPSDGGPPDGGPLGGLGERCADGDDCESGLCFPTGFGEARCTEACADTGDCVAGWTCNPFAGAMACACEDTSEVCNGLDDDCDGRVDEGDPSLIGCGSGELCVDGDCECPAARMCPDAMGVSVCTDLERDPTHCGSCDNDCGLGGICAGGSCCTPTAEACNGADDDCDGAVDESTAAECAALDGICIGGTCTCPADRSCGGSCADTLRDPSNCGGCGVTCAAGEVCAAGVCCASAGAPVDLLFMVDNSNSMAEEQAALAAELPRIVEVLATGDVDGDGVPEHTPARDLHLGVITSDMGVGGFTVPTCSPGDFGDDGVLRTQGRTDISGCAATYPSFLSFDPAGSVSPADFAADFACVARVGTGGCGFEQQLEASLKAVTPSTSPTRFFSSSTGHGDTTNAGFLRSDSIFVNVLLSDENDCSAADPDIFNPSSATYGSTDLNLRCATYPSAQHALSRYVDGLLALRSDPKDVIFAPIVGIPVDLEGASYAATLADPRMTERVDPSMTNRLTPSCNVPGTGLAFPPRRIVRVAEGLNAAGATAVVGSICQSSYAAPLESILTRVLDRLGAVCMAP